MRALANHSIPRSAPWTLAASSSVWGDGFDDDNFVALVQAVRADDIADDELVRVFPRLIGCSAMRDRLQDRLGRWLGSTRSNENNSRAARPSEATTCGEIESLGELHSDLRNGSDTDYDAALAEAFAFHVCAHPVYLWPAALESHQLWTTIAWLGLLTTGRPCFMTADVAEYICENIAIDGTRVTAHPSLERRAGPRCDLSHLLWRAKGRLDGRRDVISTANLGVSDFARQEASCR